jgi:chorismate-pyruvate lyase
VTRDIDPGIELGSDIEFSGHLSGPRWLAQAERPARLQDVAFAQLPVELRLLLIHDGTLTTALEAYQLAPIIADVEGQEEMVLDVGYARWLRATPGDHALSRRTALRQRITGRLLVHADVVLLLDRLPDTFPEVLATSDKGLGAAFARLQVETRRELLWFGRAPLRGLRPGDRALAGESGVARCYRLIVDGTPVCCIEETFPDAVIRDSRTIAAQS